MARTGLTVEQHEATLELLWKAHGAVCDAGDLVHRECGAAASEPINRVRQEIERALDLTRRLPIAKAVAG